MAQDIEKLTSKINTGTTKLIFNNFADKSAVVRLGARSLSPDVKKLEEWTTGPAVVIGEGDLKPLTLVGKNELKTVDLKAVVAFRYSDEALMESNFDEIFKNVTVGASANLIAAMDNAIIKGEVDSTGDDATAMKAMAPLLVGTKVPFEIKGDASDATNFLGKLLEVTSVDDISSENSNVALSAKGLSLLRSGTLDKNYALGLNSISSNDVIELGGSSIRRIKGLGTKNYAPAKYGLLVSDDEKPESNNVLALAGEFSGINLAIKAVKTKYFDQYYKGLDLSSANEVVFVSEIFFRVAIQKAANFQYISTDTGADAGTGA